MTTPNDKQTTSESPSCGAACSPSLIPSDERHPCRTWAANEHKETALVLADYADHLATERNEWKAALLRIHPTGRGTPDEIATDVIEGIEAAKMAIILLSGNTQHTGGIPSGAATVGK